MAHSWNHSIERYTGKPSRYTPEYLGQYFGCTMDVISQVLLPDCSPEERLRLGEDLCRGERLAGHRPGTVYPGVGDTLEQLCQKYPLYIVSNCQNGYIGDAGDHRVWPLLRRSPVLWGHRGGKGKNLVTLCRRYGLEDAVYVGGHPGGRGGLRPGRGSP